ncbi:MAG: S-methyl-5'-thioadenosine phosphorylase [Chloroflexota bacterium]|nr:S-methyl-5'-thioadenosine phosphorylase [Chloroflexota bacterium]
MSTAKIGIIGGSGLYKIEGMTGVEQIEISTPFGNPSNAIVTGKLEGVSIAFLPRHGKGHHINPSELPARANIYALKSLGVKRIISVSAAGSLKEEIQPLDLVVPDQLIDHSKGRASTFFSDGIVGHVAFAEPFCPVLSQALFEAAIKAGAKVHRGGVYLTIEGPQFSTRAESQLYRSWGADIIGMTALPEAKLAREAEICYATLAFVTDYDCWHPAYASVNTEMILSNLAKGVDSAKEILKLAIPAVPPARDCACATALKDAIATSPKYIPEKTRKKLDLLIGRYLGNRERKAG